MAEDHPNLNGFHVVVKPESRNERCNFHLSKGSWFGSMPHDNCVYILKLMNKNSEKCDADIEIDGEHIGRFRIHSYGTLELERPSHSEKRFTFFVGGSSGSHKAGYTKGSRENGLIKVVFRPESRPQPIVTSSCVSRNLGYGGDYFDEEECCEDFGGDEDGCSEGFFSTNFLESAPAPKSKSMRKSKEGITGLSGHSNQKFVTVPDLTYDKSKETTIMLRLVYSGDDIVPLGRRSSTPYPQPL